MPKPFLVDLSNVNFDEPVATIDEVRKYNRQRFEMEQLTAVVDFDKEAGTAVGYKDISEDEFWVRGHMPGMPLMPGVMMLEAAAQLCSYFAHKYDAMGDHIIGFGGLEDVRFRDPVRPGDRLVLMCKLLKYRRDRLLICQFQGVVGDTVVVDGTLKGVTIPAEMIQQLER